MKMTEWIKFSDKKPEVGQKILARAIVAHITEYPGEDRKHIDWKFPGAQEVEYFEWKPIEKSK